MSHPDATAPTPADVQIGGDADGLEKRRKRLIFRSGHRGTKELDIFFGAFAADHLAGFDDGQLDAYEALLDLPDPDVFNWIADLADPPDGEVEPAVRTLIDQMRAYRFRPAV
jgi:antitoxin CptB